MSKEGLFLVADIGGTNTRIGLADGGHLIEDATHRFKNAEFAGFQAVLERYIADTRPGPIAGACVGAAGLVVRGVTYMTNLDWKIDRGILHEVTGAEFSDVINDLQAQGYALDDMGSASLDPILTGAPEPEASRLVIGLGTGFNIVPVHRSGGKLIVPSAEAGHVAAPFRADMVEMMRWLEKDKGRATLEWLLAGQGLQNIYRFHTGDEKQASAIMQAFKNGQAAARRSLRDYISLLGTVTGDLGIAHLPLGGIYFTGGVARAMRPYFAEFGFEAAMTDKGEFQELVAGFPVTLITDDFAALKGCARYLEQATR